MKHALLVQLGRALQKKEKGYLYLDTHAGRGAYDLKTAAQGDSLARKAEWPDGIGRLWTMGDLPEALVEYVALVHEHDRSRGNSGETPGFYPGSPTLMRQIARPQDRLALCEKQPEESAALAENFQFTPNARVHAMDGYTALRAMLPPAERRALVLIDPPFEAQDEFAQIAKALGDGLRRFPSGVLAVWYPLTERARVNAFFAEVFALKPPPTLVAELEIAGDRAGLKMRGSGLLVINPPWQFEQVAAPMMAFLGEALAQAPGGGGSVSWLVKE